MSDDTSSPATAAESGENVGSMGSLAAGMAGDYTLSIGAVISEAWDRVNGNKGKIWLAVLIVVGATLGLNLIAVFLGLGGDMESGGNPLVQLLISVILLPLQVGLIFVGIKIACDRDASPGSVLSWYPHLLKLAITYVLMVLMLIVGFLLLVLPGIYLSVAYMLALPLAVDKDLSPWQALEASRKALTHRWFTLFGLLLVAMLMFAVSTLLLGIPLIWVLPAFVIGLGVVYRNVFGAEERSLAE